jgi:hypothetical protein
LISRRDRARMTLVMAIFFMVIIIFMVFSDAIVAVPSRGDPKAP